MIMSSVYRSRRVVLVALVAFFLCSLAQDVAAAPRTELTMRSQRHDWVGAGRNWHYTGSDGDWSAYASDYNRDGAVDYLSFFFINSTTFWSLDFGTNQLGTPIRTGFYPDAQRAAFADSGHPGIDVGGDGRGCNTISGSFTITECVIDYVNLDQYGNPTITSFGVEFEQHCEGGRPALFGSFLWNSEPKPIIDDVVYRREKDKVIIRGTNFLDGATVSVDGQPYEPSTVKNSVIKIRDVRLQPGIHEFIVLNSDGTTSLPFRISI